MHICRICRSAMAPCSWGHTPDQRGLRPEECLTESSEPMALTLKKWCHEMLKKFVFEVVWVLDIGERWHRAHSHAPLRSFVQVGRHAYLTPGTPPQSKMSRCELVEWKPKKTNFYTKRHGANFSNKNSEMILLEKMYGWLCFSEHSVFKFAAAVPCMVSQALNFALGTNFEQKICIDSEHWTHCDVWKVHPTTSWKLNNSAGPCCHTPWWNAVTQLDTCNHM